MELLIPGLILVALMMYASTRIKKSAARAYEAETIETNDFIIQKPEGFLNVIGGDPQYAFEAYSKEYGSSGDEEFRQATAKLRIYKNGKDAAAGLHDILSDRSEVIAGNRHRIVESKLAEKGIQFRVFTKIAETDSNTYVLEIITLAETTAELMRNIELMLDNFELKIRRNER